MLLCKASSGYRTHRNAKFPRVTSKRKIYHVEVRPDAREHNAETEGHLEHGEVDHVDAPPALATLPRRLQAIIARLPGLRALAPLPAEQSLQPLHHSLATLTIVTQTATVQPHYTLRSPRRMREVNKEARAQRNAPPPTRSTARLIH